MFAKLLPTLLTVITLTYQAFALTDDSRADSYPTLSYPAVNSSSQPRSESSAKPSPKRSRNLAK